VNYVAPAFYVDVSTISAKLSIMAYWSFNEGCRDKNFERAEHWRRQPSCINIDHRHCAVHISV
jgi:hypothetical protein